MNRTFLLSPLLLLAACAPALNWRDVHEAPLALAMQFPCKPQRLVEDGTGMLQCEADGQRFVLSWRTLAEPALARDALRTLPAVLAERLHAQPEALPGARLPEGAADWPGAGRYALRGGERLAWLQSWTQGTVLIQALVLGEAEPALQFFDSLKRKA
jgi:hypothetical protein